MNTAVIALLRELPSHTIVWRTTGKSFTAEELIKEIELGTETGLQYASDLLRIARDFLSRKAKKEKQ